MTPINVNHKISPQLTKTQLHPYEPPPTQSYIPPIPLQHNTHPIIPENAEPNYSNLSCKYTHRTGHYTHPNHIDTHNIHNPTPNHAHPSVTISYYSLPHSTQLHLSPIR
jgi:hypothetical protein